MVTSDLSDATRQLLVQRAMEARQNAYAIYSDYWVGAALLSVDNEIFTGCNVENASYPAGMCAERTAVVKAVSEGARKFVAIAVVSANGGSPCGICRQVLSEFSSDMWVIVANKEGQILYEESLNELLPRSFGPAHLNVSPE